MNPLHRLSTNGCAAALALVAALLFTPPARAQLGGNDPALTALQGSCGVDLSGQNTSGICTLGPVPPGKRLVIENVSASCTVAGLGLTAPDIKYIQLVTRMNATWSPSGVISYTSTHIPVRKLGAQFSGVTTVTWNAALAVRLYTDPSYSVELQAGRFGGVTGAATGCSISFHGHLVTIPQ
jgi:hypothetical protein